MVLSRKDANNILRFLNGDVSSRFRCNIFQFHLELLGNCICVDRYDSGELYPDALCGLFFFAFFASISVPPPPPPLAHGMPHYKAPSAF